MSAFARAARLMSGASLALALLAFGATARSSSTSSTSAAPCSRPIRSSSNGSARHVLVGYRAPSDLAGADRAPRHRGPVPQRAQRRGPIRRCDPAADRRAAGDPPPQGLAPLWIATDQEGGAVSRLSPPLTRMPPIADIVALHRDHAERLLAIRQYAARQGRELAGLGVNLNFAPVVDLNHGVAQSGGPPHAHLDARDLGGSRGRHRGRRALLRDAEADRRALHAEALSRSRTRLRRHPQGHGGARHARAGARGVRLASIPATDGGRCGLHDARAMRGSPRSTAIGRPRSPMRWSRGCCASTWKHDGILVTDDFSMGAVTLEPRGRGGGADRGAQCRRRPDSGQLRSGSVLLRDVRPAGGRARRAAYAPTCWSAAQRGCAGPRCRLSRHQLRIFAVKSRIDRPATILNKALKSLLLRHCPGYSSDRLAGGGRGAGRLMFCVCCAP